MVVKERSLSNFLLILLGLGLRSRFNWVSSQQVSHGSIKLLERCTEGARAIIVERIIDLLEVFLVHLLDHLGLDGRLGALLLEDRSRGRHVLVQDLIADFSQRREDVRLLLEGREFILLHAGELERIERQVLEHLHVVHEVLVLNSDGVRKVRQQEVVHDALDEHEAEDD